SVDYEPARVVGRQQLGERRVEGRLLIALRAHHRLREQGRVGWRHRRRVRAGERCRRTPAPAATGSEERRARSDRERRAADHSTVTVFARLRGWSTFRPRRRATWYARS